MKKKPKGWYKQLVLRPVVYVEGYESYEKICSTVADAYFSTEEEFLLKKIVANPKDSMYISFYTLFKVGQAKCPAYWANKDLLEALMQSDLTVEADSLNWAMKTGMFLLPKNAIISPEQRSIDAIFWHHDIDNHLLYWAASDGVSLFCRRFKSTDNLRKLIYTDVQDFNPQLVTEFNEYLQAIFLRLILIMECRTDLVDTTSDVIRVNKGFGREQAQDFYQPLWIGQNYRVKRENESIEGSSSTGTSKSVHWRRGFLRNQPYGEGRQHRKLIWIEPVLVMGHE
jgi:hypothetical protein